MTELEQSISLKKVKELSRIYASSVDGEGAGGIGIYLFDNKECYCCEKMTYQNEQRQIFSKKIDKKIKWNWNKNFKDMVVCASCSKLVKEKFSERVSKYE